MMSGVTISKNKTKNSIVSLSFQFNYQLFSKQNNIFVFIFLFGRFFLCIYQLKNIEL